MRVVEVEAVAEHRVRKGGVRRRQALPEPDDGRVWLAAELGHRRPAFPGDAGRMCGEPAPERVEQVQLRRVGNRLRHVLEGQ